jgi:hypothetical protein
LVERCRKLEPAVEYENLLQCVSLLRHLSLSQPRWLSP